MRRNRCQQLTRVLALLRRLEGLRAGLTAAELAREFRAHPRTIARDLEALEGAGVPLAEDAGRWLVFDWRSGAAHAA